MSGDTLVRPFTVTLDRPVRFDIDAPRQLVEHVAWLRDRHSDVRDVRWTAVVDPRVDTSLVWHLPPPDADGTDAVDEWRVAHRPAMCYYRVGPGFLQIKDARRPDASAILSIEDGPLVEAFTACLQPCRRADLPADIAGATATLIKERLVLDVGGWMTTLPSRLRRWPVPSQIA
jgi:Family of unknown function (DUF5825)